MKNNQEENSIKEDTNLQENGEAMKLYGENSFFEPHAAFVPFTNSILNEDDLIVTEKAIRDAGEENSCFSCGKSVGEKHDKDCQTIRKSVRIHIDGYIEVSLPSNLNCQETIGTCDNVVDNASACMFNNLGEVVGDVFCQGKLYLNSFDTEKLAIIEEDINPIDY